MRSIPLVMTWELVQRSRWMVVLGLLAGNAIPMLILTALRLEGEIDATDPAAVVLQMVTVQVMSVAFAASALFALEIAPRTYAQPVATSTLVAWRMVPAMVLVFLETLFSLLAVNTIFRLDWPIVGPAVLAPVALAVVLASLWIAEKSVLQPLSLTVAGLVIGLWFKSRYGAIFAPPEHYWSQVTPIDVLTLIVFAVVSYAVAIVGVSRNRCGEPLSNFNLVAWLEQVFDRPMELPRDGQSVRFQTPWESQYWNEWTRKGMILPATVFFALITGLGIWLVFNRNPKELVEMLTAGSPILMGMAVFGGLVVGNCGRNDKSPDMGNFLATRPLTNRDLSRIILQVGARSVLISWAIWAVTFGVVIAIIVLSGGSNYLQVLKELRWWYLPGSLLGTWIVVSTIASIYLTGRTVFLAKAVCTLFTMLVAGMLVSKLLDHEARTLLLIVTTTAFGLVISATAFWLMSAAWRRSLVSGSEIVSGICIWLGLSAVVIFECGREASQVFGIQFAMAVLLVGVAAFSVVPFAAAPLAIACNRHR